MTSAYELVAATRPRIRRDVLFTRTPEGVLFHNGHGGFQLTAKTAYRFVSLLVPHLNGHNRVDEICRTLGPEQQTRVAELVKALYERDFARDVLPEDVDQALPAEVVERFAAQIAYIDHYTDHAANRFRRFRESRVAVLGTGPIARWCASSLIRNGCAQVALQALADEVVQEAAELSAEIVRLDDGVLDWARLAGYDLVVAAGGAGAAAQTLHLLRTGIPEGSTLLPAWTLGNRAIVGPLTTAGTAGCWVCAALRLSANGDGGTAADLWRAVSFPAFPAAAPSSGQIPEPVSAMLGNLLGYEIYRLTTGVLPAETAGKVIIQNLESLDVLSEALLPYPGCPACGGEVTDPQPLPRDLTAGEEPEEQSAEALIAELDERAVLIGRHAGVFTGFTDEPWIQVPLKVSTVTLAIGHRVRREVSAFDVHHVAAARRRALHAAAGVHAEHIGATADAQLPEDLFPVPSEARRSDRTAPPRVDPATLSIASGIGAPMSAVTAWTAATSILTGKVRLVPAAAVRTFGQDNHGRMFSPTRAGTGAGATVAEAVRQGLLSALCYPALIRAVRGTAATARVALDTADGSPELTFLIKSANNLGVELELLDLAADAAHVLFARTVDRGEGSAMWRIAAHPHWARAAVDVVRDLLGAVQLGRQLPDGDIVDDGDPVLIDLAPAALAVTTEVPARVDARGSLAEVLDRLRATDLDALAVDTTTADLRLGGIATARILLSGPVA
jgi:bacteriocin biosynthesis cyclodehydratase domain-containing protein